jgi:hypothetical protein
MTKGVRVIGVRRKEPDMQMLAKALIAMARESSKPGKVTIFAGLNIYSDDASSKNRSEEVTHRG